MRLVKAIFATVLAISLAGCVLRGKQKTAAAPPAPQPAPAAVAAAPPPEPLSIPQTQVVLPPPQPVNPEALAVPATEPAPETAAAPPRSSRRSGTSNPQPPKPEAAAPVGPPALPVEPRPPIQEMVPAAEQKRLQDSADARKREIQEWLNIHGRKRLKREQQAKVDLMRAFVKNSDLAEKRGDMREADTMAERAQILLRELQGPQ